MMKSVILFKESCAFCESLAEEIGCVAGGLVEVRSLDDPSLAQFLDGFTFK